jgi:hypothetical protein
VQPIKVYQKRFAVFCVPGEIPPAPLTGDTMLLCVALENVWPDPGGMMQQELDPKIPRSIPRDLPELQALVFDMACMLLTNLTGMPPDLTPDA